MLAEAVMHQHLVFTKNKSNRGANGSRPSADFTDAQRQQESGVDSHTMQFSLVADSKKKRKKRLFCFSTKPEATCRIRDST